MMKDKGPDKKNKGQTKNTPKLPYLKIALRAVSGCRTVNVSCRMLDASYRMVNVSRLTINVGCWMVNASCLMIDFSYRMVNVGCRILTTICTFPINMILKNTDIKEQ
jgi:hypothetical protein